MRRRRVTASAGLHWLTILLAAQCFSLGCQGTLLHRTKLGAPDVAIGAEPVAGNSAESKSQPEPLAESSLAQEPSAAPATPAAVLLPETISESPGDRNLPAQPSPTPLLDEALARAQEIQSASIAQYQEQPAIIQIHDPADSATPGTLPKAANQRPDLVLSPVPNQSPPPEPAKPVEPAMELKTQSPTPVQPPLAPLDEPPASSQTPIDPITAPLIPSVPDHQPPAPGTPNIPDDQMTPSPESQPSPAPPAEPEPNVEPHHFLEPPAPVLAIAELQFCRRVLGFGSYEAVDGNSLKPGQTITLYCQMVGLLYEKSGDDFRSRLSSVVVISQGEGQEPLWSLDLGAVEDHCHKERRDYYVGYRFTLPAPQVLAPGSYLLTLRQKDLLTGKEIFESLPMRIVPGGS